MVFAQLPPFVTNWRRARPRLRDEDLQALELALIEDPTAGDVMKGTGGLRKARFAPPSWGVGKSGALRVCYVHFPKHDRLYLVTMFAKNEKDNLAQAERNAIRALIGRISAALDAGEPHA
jgi:hypothetical protein